MRLRDVIADGMIVGMSVALLWHFSNIWRYDQYLIQEPNMAIKTVETVGLLVILGFGLSKLISDFKSISKSGKHDGKTPV